MAGDELGDMIAVMLDHAGVPGRFLISLGRSEGEPRCRWRLNKLDQQVVLPDREGRIAKSRRQAVRCESVYIAGLYIFI